MSLATVPSKLMKSTRYSIKCSVNKPSVTFLIFRGQREHLYKRIVFELRNVGAQRGKSGFSHYAFFDISWGSGFDWSHTVQNQQKIQRGGGGEKKDIQHWWRLIVSLISISINSKTMHYQSEKSSEIWEKSWAVWVETCSSSPSGCVIVSVGTCEGIVHRLLPLLLIVLSLLLLFLPQLLCLAFLYFFLQGLSNFLNFFSCQFRLWKLGLGIDLLKGIVDPLFDFFNLFSWIVFDWSDFATDSSFNELRKFWQLLFNFRVFALSILDSWCKFVDFSLDFICLCWVVTYFIQSIFYF